MVRPGTPMPIGGAGGVIDGTINRTLRRHILIQVWRRSLSRKRSRDSLPRFERQLLCRPCLIDICRWSKDGRGRCASPLTARAVGRCVLPTPVSLPPVGGRRRRGVPGREGHVGLRLSPLDRVLGLSWPAIPMDGLLRCHRRRGARRSGHLV